MPEAVTFQVAPKSRAAPRDEVHAFYYAPKNPDFTAPAGRAAAAAGADARRADRRHVGRARRRSAVLDQPRLRGARRQLQRQHRLRPRRIAIG